MTELQTKTGTNGNYIITIPLMIPPKQKKDYMDFVLLTTDTIKMLKQKILEENSQLKISFESLDGCRIASSSICHVLGQFKIIMNENIFLIILKTNELKKKSRHRTKSNSSLNPKVKVTRPMSKKNNSWDVEGETNSSKISRFHSPAPYSRSISGKKGSKKKKGSQANEKKKLFLSLGFI